MNPANLAAADQEEAQLQHVLRGLIAAYPTFSGTEENQVGTTYLALRMAYTDYGDMACAAAELVRMIVHANAETKRWRDVADALSVKLTGVTAEGLVAVPREAMKCEAPQSGGCQYPPTHIAEYLTGKTSVVDGEQLPVTHRIPVCGDCVNDVPNLHRVRLMGGPR